jgi:hypothetical protein
VHETAGAEVRWDINWWAEEKEGEGEEVRRERWVGLVPDGDGAKAGRGREVEP